MNIIKFKDIIKTGDVLFNTYLKGKYAYWIQMRYIVPFEFITQAQYVEFEGDITKLINWRERGEREPNPRYWDLYSKTDNIPMYVDSEKTDTANNISSFMRSNSFTTDEDLTIEEIKKFRTWLAKTLLSFDRQDPKTQANQLFSEEFTDILQYYANGMYNITIKRLSNLNPGYQINSTIKMSDCGCGVGTDVSGLYGRSINSCDPLYVYKRSIYTDMCQKFSNVDFWKEFSYEFLMEFQKYINNIIQLNLPLTKSQYISNFTDCSCLIDSNQLAHIDILRRLSKALSYIANDELQGNKNFISKALTEWAETLYEMMEWN